MSNEAAAVLPTIYRSLLRLGRQLDKNPLSKALLIAQPAHLFDRRSRAVIKLPSLSGWSSALESFNGGEFYSPENSAQQAVRGAFINPPPGDPLDVGFTALRSLGLAAMGGEALEREHAFDGGGAVERLSAVRATSTVKAGSLLLTHPVSCLKQPTLHHAVILIIAADDDSVSGLVINKPLDVTLSAAISDKVKISVGETLSSYPLYKGGDVSERQLLLLHDIEGLSESTPVVDGLYATSSFPEVRDALEKYHEETAAAETEVAMGDDASGGIRRRSPPRVKCVAGFAGWAKAQLQAELQRNVWFLVEAEDAAAVAMMEPPAAAADGSSSGGGDGAAWLRDEMWSGALKQLGGEHAALARFPGDHEVVWKHMQDIWSKQSEELHRRIDLLEPKDGKGGGDES